MIFLKIFRGVLVAYIIFFMIGNASMSSSAAALMSAMPTVATASATSKPAATSPSSTQVQALAAQLIPTGVPPVYGAELKVSFLKVVESMPIMQSYDQGPGKNGLTGDALQRYIRIASRIACEYCCGAKSLVFTDGKAACACAHSGAMRGLAVYLITKHGQELTDDQILAELAKWKATFFPKQTVETALAKSGSATGSTAPLPSQVGGC